MNDNPEERFDPKGFGKRLQSEMKRRDLTIKDLERAVKERLGEKAPGTSYGSLWSYVKGQAPAEPRRQVVGAIAETVGTLPRYLMYGEGPRTKQEAAQRGEVVDLAEDWPDAAREEWERWRIRRRATERARESIPFELHGVPEGLWWWMATDLLEAGGEDLHEHTEDELVEILESLAWLWSLPWMALRAGQLEAEEVPWRQVDAYFAGMYQAMRAVMPEPGTGHPERMAKFLRELREAIDSKTIPLQEED